ncbi:hypothetical protein N9L47_02045 [Rhodobacteraceae bacterium]|nr:hypothetical protein [Paracoccaceae bacterium]
MPDQNLSYDIAFFRAFQRPAWVVMMVAQMILGLALAITLILKIYMLVFSPYACTADGETLGNIIRCTGTLETIAHFLLAMAGFRVAAFMFVDRPRMLLGPLMLGIAGVLLLFLSGLTLAEASWPVAAVIVVLFASMTAIVLGQTLLARWRGRGADTNKET